MSSSVVLPPAMRRMRHIEQFLARNLPKKGSSDACLNTYLVIRIDNSVVYISGIEKNTQHPVFQRLPSSFCDLPSNNTSSFVCSIHETQSDAPDPAKDALVFECSVDLTRMQFISKTIASLFDLHSLPSHVGSGEHQLVFLIKCTDGVFFPSLISPEIAEVEKLAARAPTPPLEVRNNKDTNASYEASKMLSEWDVVDADLVREEEKRMQKTDSITVGDAKALVSTTLTVALARKFLTIDLESRRAQLTKTLTDRQREADLTARRNEVSARIAVTKAKVEARRQAVTDLRKAVEQKKEDFAKRRAALEQHRSEVADQGSTESNKTTLTSDMETAASRLKSVQSNLLSETTSVLQCSGDAICGMGVSEENPEGDAHALALGHVAHMLQAVCRVHGCVLPHPLHLSGNRSSVYEREGDESRKYPLYVVKASAKPMTRKAIELLRGNILCAALSIYKQQQAEDLPLLIALQKLIENR